MPAETASEPRGVLIAGSWRTAAEAFTRRDPSNPDRATGTYAAASAVEVQAAYDAAAAAAPRWGRRPAPERAEVLRRAADLLEARSASAAERLTADIGKAIRDARAEVLRAVAILRYHAGEALQADGETYPSSAADTMVITTSEPVGVVCAITPWNFPLAIPAWKLAPALSAGNPVVWKPATAASGSAVLLAEILVEAGLPEGALNLLTGPGPELSEALTVDSRLAALSFTGSAQVGWGLQAAVADRGVKVQLELGGKNPAIVLADADLPDAALQVASGAMGSTGQRCTATSRVYVEDPVLERFTELLLERVRELVVGDPFDEATDVGPVASLEQLRTVGSYLDLAAAEPGVRVLAGGGRSEPGDGYWVDADGAQRRSRREPARARGDLRAGGDRQPDFRLRGRARGRQRHPVRTLRRDLHAGPRPGDVVRARDRVGPGAHQPRDRRRRAAGALRRAQGVEQSAARAGQGGEAVLHQLEDRLRPRPLTLPRSLAHALQRQPRRAARLGDLVLRPLGALIGAPELG